LRTELSNLFRGPDVRFQPSSEELVNAFDSNKKWWLLVDGIDDSGSASEMVRLVREALRYAKDHDGRIVLSSRRNLFEYVVEKTVSDDLSFFLHDAWVVSVNGLDQDGFERRKQNLITQKGEQASAAQHGFDVLDAEAQTDAESKALVASIRRMALVVDGIAQLDLESGDLKGGTRRRRLIASWAATRQFESHCLGELCGNDERKAAIERTWRLMTTCLGEYSRAHDSIGLDALDEEIGRINRNPEIGRDTVLYALLGTGILEPFRRDTFRINKVWVPSPRVGSRSACILLLHQRP